MAGGSFHATILIGIEVTQCSGPQSQRIGDVFLGVVGVVGLVAGGEVLLGSGLGLLIRATLALRVLNSFSLSRYHALIQQLNLPVRDSDLSSSSVVSHHVLAFVYYWATFFWLLVFFLCWKPS